MRRRSETSCAMSARPRRRRSTAGILRKRTSDRRHATRTPIHAARYTATGLALRQAGVGGAVRAPEPPDAAIVLAPVKDEPFGWRCAPSLHCRAEEHRSLA